MARDLSKMLMPDDPIMLEAFECLKRYHTAQAQGRPLAEVEKLKLIADQHFEKINEYQLAALGHQPLTRH
ncbi:MULTISPECIES: hypothetical protein [unclassified Pseudomonas]|uniref:hypothetical protein n=1 Tax=unclassified Pseudomonas TaxID=196821 RepID=UPI000B505BB9|nr:MULTISPECIES: hypothetical protein [unclassified Pseudomonas]TFA89509.1 hypothetical protein F473_01696 [Pseudomonas sp. URIL14HWK12:I1]SNB69959.1 hypothetical protein SAMN02746026_01740 [Pseudomonas sp. LAIL14HWK12:I4]